MSDTDLKEFAQSIKAEIADFLQEYPDDTREVALAEYYLSSLMQFGAISEPTSCQYADTEGRNRCAANAYKLDDDDSDLTIYLTWEAGEEVELSAPKQKLTELAWKAARFIDYALNKDHERFIETESALEAAEAIYAARKKITQIRAIILTDAIAKERVIEEIKIHGFDLVVEVYDLTRLFRITKAGSVRADIIIDFEKILGRPLPCLEMKPKPQEYETYIAIFPGSLIWELYEDFGSQLLEFNVRSYLQAKTNVNKGMQESRAT